MEKMRTEVWACGLILCSGRHVPHPRSSAFAITLRRKPLSSCSSLQPGVSETMKQSHSRAAPVQRRCLSRNCHSYCCMPLRFCGLLLSTIVTTVTNAVILLDSAPWVLGNRFSRMVSSILLFPGLHMGQPEPSFPHPLASSSYLFSAVLLLSLNLSMAQAPHGSSRLSA